MDNLTFRNTEKTNSQTFSFFLSFLLKIPPTTSSYYYWGEFFFVTAVLDAFDQGCQEMISFSKKINKSIVIA